MCHLCFDMGSNHFLEPCFMGIEIENGKNFQK